jgi:CRP-like cAMP-binding protein
MAFLDGQTRSATAIAAKDTTLLVITRQAFDDLLRDHPTLIAKLLPGLIRVLILRLRRTNVKLVDRLTD